MKPISPRVLSKNVTMLKMCRELGFNISRDPDDKTVYLVTLDLGSPGVVKLTQWPLSFSRPPRSPEEDTPSLRCVLRAP